MKTVTKKKLYEAMFLVDSADAGSDWDGVIAAIKRILKRAKVDIVSIKKWDDRRLAYEIKRMARGTYILCYFRSAGQTNQQIEKAVQLSEKIVRVLILCVDWMTDEDIEKDTPATKAEKEEEKRDAASEAPEPNEAAKSEAEDDAEASAIAEPTEEAVRAETVATDEEAEHEGAAEVAKQPDAAGAIESATSETGDSEEIGPKASADD